MNSSVNRRRCSRRSMTPWNIRSARTIGTTDQKILARNVAKLNQPHRRSVSPAAGPGNPLERVFESDGPDDIRAKAFVLVDRQLHVAANEERPERVPLESEGEVHDVVPRAGSAGLPATEDVGSEGQARVQAQVEPGDVPEVVVRARPRRHLVAHVQVRRDEGVRLGDHEHGEEVGMPGAQQVVGVAAGQLHLEERRQVRPRALVAEELYLVRTRMSPMPVVSPPAVTWEGLEAGPKLWTSELIALLRMIVALASARTLMWMIGMTS